MDASCHPKICWSLIDQQWEVDPWRSFLILWLILGGPGFCGPSAQYTQLLWVLIPYVHVLLRSLLHYLSPHFPSPSATTTYFSWYTSSYHLPSLRRMDASLTGLSFHAVCISLFPPTRFGASTWHTVLSWSLLLQRKESYLLNDKQALSKCLSTEELFPENVWLKNIPFRFYIFCNRV